MGLPCPSPAELPKPGMEPGSPALQTDSLPSEPQGWTNILLITVISVSHSFDKLGFQCHSIQNTYNFPSVSYLALGLFSCQIIKDIPESSLLLISNFI